MENTPQVQATAGERASQRKDVDTIENQVRQARSLMQLCREACEAGSISDALAIADALLEDAEESLQELQQFDAAAPSPSTH